MSDLISRQAAIDEIRKCRFVVDAIEKIRDLPSVQPRKGKWERIYRNGFGNLIGHCDKCGRTYPVDNFCPNCGADMRGEEE